MELDNEFAKVRSILHQIVDRIHLPSESEVKALKASIDQIYDTTVEDVPEQPVSPLASPSPGAPASNTNPVPVPVSFADASSPVVSAPSPDVSSLSDAALEAELARRNLAV